MVGVAGVTSLRKMLVPGLLAKPEIWARAEYVPETEYSVRQARWQEDRTSLWPLP